MRRPAATATLILAGLSGLALFSGGAGSLPPSLDADPPASAPAQVPGPAAAPTTLQTLDGWVEAVAAEAARAAGDPALAGEVVGQPGGWQFVALGRPVVVLAVAEADRMRVMTPVVDGQGAPVRLDEAAVRRVLQANFDTALDARYALRDGQLWSTYLHPLATLTAQDFRSGVIQVLNLAHNFGTTYSSTGLRFGVEEDAGGGPDAPDAGPVQII